MSVFVLGSNFKKYINLNIFFYLKQCSGEPETPPTTSLRYHHVPIQGSRQESYLSLALESALIALGQQRIMPSGLYAQEMSVKQEERLLAKLQELDLGMVLNKMSI